MLWNFWDWKYAASSNPATIHIGQCKNGDYFVTVNDNGKKRTLFTDDMAEALMVYEEFDAITFNLDELGFV